MSEQMDQSAEAPVTRCPVCDSVVAVEAKRCLMCGAAQPERPFPPASAPLPIESEPKPEPEVVETAVSPQRQRSLKRPHSC
ncbi:MAG: hypothetical protein M5U34_25655 [Chloroflexi bacterium]|nr:hypothetical protein [Chloroflexota bacterium]